MSDRMSSVYPFFAKQAQTKWLKVVGDQNNSIQVYRIVE